MTRRYTSILAILSMLVLLGCERLNQDSSLNRILPLGASRVQGERPYFESYRYELWQLLVNDEWDFDFIGTLEDDANYPRHNGKRFDRDHEGRGGWTSTEIRYGLPYWVESEGAPDIVLFSSPGGNDILRGEDYPSILENIVAIIDLLRAKNPNVTILMEQMAPGTVEFMEDEDLTDVFTQIRADVADIASNMTTANSKIIAIDMYTGFDDSMLADEVHYNEKGAEFIANRYYGELKELLVR